MKNFFLVAVLALFAFQLSAQSEVLVADVQNGKIESIEAFLQEGHEVDEMVAVDDESFTLLCLAAKAGQSEAAALLIEKGADVELMCHNKTPLMFAAKYGHREVAELLIEKGADAAKKNEEDMSALDLAVKFQQTDVVDLLKAKGATTTAQ